MRARRTLHNRFTHNRAMASEFAEGVRAGQQIGIAQVLVAKLDDMNAGGDDFFDKSSEGFLGLASVDQYVEARVGQALQ